MHVFTFAAYILSSFLLAILITVVLLLLTIGVMRVSFSRYSLHMGWGFILGMTTLGLFLFCQSFLLCGAGFIKKQVGIVEEGIQAVMQVDENRSGLTVQEIERVKTTIMEEFPPLKGALRNIDESEYKEGVTSVVSLVYTHIHSYMWRRILWMLGALFGIGGILYYKEYKAQQRAEYLRNRLLNL